MQNPSSKIKWTTDVPPVQDPGSELEGIPFYDSKNVAPKCVIGLDRDGVINVDRGTYTFRPEDFIPIPGSLEAMAKLRREGHKIVVITNQSGIGKGLYTSADVERVHEHMFQLLGQAGCLSIDGLFYSNTNLRSDVFAKPNIGMFKRCEDEIKHIKFNKGYFVGDKMSDLKAAHKVGAVPVLVRTGYGLETEKELDKWTYRDIKSKTKVFDDLAAFVESISLVK